MGQRGGGPRDSTSRGQEPPGINIARDSESRRISRLLAEEDDGEEEDDEPLRGVGYRLHQQIKTETHGEMGKQEQVPARAIFVQGSLWVWSATSRGHPPDGDRLRDGAQLVQDAETAPVHG